jgi:hypothetical protein
MVPLDTHVVMVETIRVLMPVVSGTRTLGALLAIDLSMTYGPHVLHNMNNVNSWLEDIVSAHQRLLDQIVEFSGSDFDGAHSAFRLMIICAVRRYGFMLRTRPHNIFRPYLVIANNVVRTVVFYVMGSLRRYKRTIK